MSDTTAPLRVLFCGAVLQNFFDLPASEIGLVWKATGEMLKGIRNLFRTIEIGEHRMWKYIRV